MEIGTLLQAALIALMIYCLFRLIIDNYRLIRTQNFLKDPENAKLLLALLKYVNYVVELRGKTCKVPEINSIEEFKELNPLDQDLVMYSVETILEDKQAYIDFFKERGDI